MELLSDNIKSYFKKNEDITERELNINNVRINMFYFDGLINSGQTSDFILKPLFQQEIFKASKTEKEIITAINDGNLYFVNQKTRCELEDVLDDILSGSVALIFNFAKTAITFDIKGFEKRGVAEPTTENIIKGSKEAFVESIRVNTTLVRRRIKSTDLKIENITIGKRTKTVIDLFYIDSIANLQKVAELKDKIAQIQTDAVLSVSLIEEYLTNSKAIIFPTLQTTELADKFCASIAEGYIGFIIDGIPIGFINPTTLNQCMQAPEDYAQNYIFNSCVRILRYVLLLVTLVLPSFYISVTTYHQDMLPTELVQFIATSKEGVPFPSFLEVIFMLLAFEFLHEAALRLPKTIGQAVSIVGGVIIGQAAVSAKLVSPSVVVIISLAAIAGYVIPNQDLSNAIRIWRLLLVIMSSLFGLFGLGMGMLILLSQLAQIEILGVPYLSPFVESDNKTFKDTFIRYPLPLQTQRPSALSPQDNIRRVS